MTTEQIEDIIETLLNSSKEICEKNIDNSFDIIRTLLSFGTELLSIILLTVPMNKSEKTALLDGIVSQIKKRLNNND